MRIYGLATNSIVPNPSIEIDCGSLTNDVQGIRKYCEQTRMLAQACRDPTSESALKNVDLPKQVRALESFGREFTASLSTGMHEHMPFLHLVPIAVTKGHTDAADRIFREIDVFITSTADAGIRREMVGLLQMEEYIMQRHANGAVGTTSLLLELR